LSWFIRVDESKQFKKDVRYQERYNTDSQIVSPRTNHQQGRKKKTTKKNRRMKTEKLRCFRNMAMTRSSLHYKEFTSMIKMNTENDA